MSRFDSTCPACGKAFRNSHIEMLTFCSVGCQVNFAIEAVPEPDNAALVELGRKVANALGELADARSELEGLRSLIAEAHRELSTIEAITVSPSDTDGLLDLVRRLKEAMPRNAEQKEARLRALGFEPVSEEQRAENLLVNLGVAK